MGARGCSAIEIKNHKSKIQRTKEAKRRTTEELQPLEFNLPLNLPNNILVLRNIFSSILWSLWPGSSLYSYWSPFWS